LEGDSVEEGEGLVKTTGENNGCEQGA
jgi:hypothetical protein